jgi:hypothetical protein
VMVLLENMRRQTTAIQPQLRPCCSLRCFKCWSIIPG